MSEAASKTKTPSWSPTTAHKSDSHHASRPFLVPVQHQPQVPASQDLSGYRQPQSGDMIDNVRRYQQINTSSGPNEPTATKNWLRLLSTPQPTGLTIQSKLTIREPGDSYEQEADKVASEVRQRLDAESSSSSTRKSGKRLQFQAPPNTTPWSQPAAMGEHKLWQQIPRQENQLVGQAISKFPILPSQEKLDMVSEPAIQAKGEMTGDHPDSSVEQRPNKTGMPDHLKAGIENLSGIAMDDVKVHYNSSTPSQLQALAYTQGTDIHVAPGQERHLAHEAWHVVQQKQGRVKPTLQAKEVAINDDSALEQEADVMGTRAASSYQIDRSEQKISGVTSSVGVVQGYFEQGYLTSDWLQADDMTLAVQKGYPNHQLYAKVGKAAAANQKLAAVNSGIELIETGQEDTFWEGSRWSPTRQNRLKKIEAKNKKNNTQGDNMLLYADCGKSNTVVVGSQDRQAVYDKPGGAANTKVPGTPETMKIAIIKAWMEHKQNTLDPSKAAEKLEITLALNKGVLSESNLHLLEGEYAAANTDAERRDIKNRYKKTLEKTANTYWEYYNKLPEATRDQVDAALKINRYAKPDIGQGYTTSSGGASAGKPTWNFHWGGVVMASDDGKDNVVLENYAVGDPTVENRLWTFDMYGTEKKGQSFHERHKDTQQHGQTPTTMTIEKNP